MQLNNQVLVFPGQGSQKIGMGKDLYQNYAVAKQVFDCVDEALSFKLSDLMFDGDEQELNKTSNAQPAIIAVSMAYFEALKEKSLISLDNVKFMAGHSLGEYSALCAAGVLTLEDTALLLKKRGQAMMKACLETQGAMAAIIGFDYEKAKFVADNAGCYVGNSNSPAQIVLSGKKEDIERACVLAKEQGAKRAIPLAVSGAFHSPLMQSAADEMEEVLAQTKLMESQVKVVSNLSAREYENSSEIREKLVDQITHTVKWQESINFIANSGGTEFIEVGFGAVLSGLIKKILPEVKVSSSEELLNNL
ncbi:MAG: ACP S-malonyltransferase [Alphaproteobacteria bacterium]|nr:ACP S-malonyltransferase [Alphaproteobacteria bacterium]